MANKIKQLPKREQEQLSIELFYGWIDVRNTNQCRIRCDVIGILGIDDDENEDVLPSHCGLCFEA